MSKRLGGIIDCKDDKTSSWHLNGFPHGSNIDCVNNSILLSGSERRAAASIEKQKDENATFSPCCVGCSEGLLDVCECFLCFLPIDSGHQVRWTYQPGSHRRKVTQDFSSAFFLRCVP